VRAYRGCTDHAIVSYINTSLAGEGGGDILCTSRNAVAVVNSIPAGASRFCSSRTATWGTGCRSKPGRPEHDLVAGKLHVHATFAARKLVAARMEHPVRGGRPSRVPPDVLRGGIRRSTTAIIPVLRPDGRRRVSS